MIQEQKEILCPGCGGPVQVSGFGPFFTPDPVWRLALECVKKCWRGRMCATKLEAEKREKEKVMKTGYIIAGVLFSLALAIVAGCAANKQPVVYRMVPVFQPVAPRGTASVPQLMQSKAVVVPAMATPAIFTLRVFQMADVVLDNPSGEWKRLQKSDDLTSWRTVEVFTQSHTFTEFRLMNSGLFYRVVPLAFAWDAGPLPNGDVSLTPVSYVIKWGYESGYVTGVWPNSVPVSGAATQSEVIVTGGPIYFVVTAIAASGAESAPSNELVLP